MNVQVSPQLEVRLRELARRAGVGIDVLVDNALRQYVDAEAVTDVTPADVCATQAVLISEIGGPIHDRPC